MTLPNVTFSDDADWDTVVSVLRDWNVHVYLHDGRRLTGVVSGLEEPLLILSHHKIEDWEQEVDVDKIHSLEVI